MMPQHTGRGWLLPNEPPHLPCNAQTGAELVSPKGFSCYDQPAQETRWQSSPRRGPPLPGPSTAFPLFFFCTETKQDKLKVLGGVGGC